MPVPDRNTKSLNHLYGTNVLRLLLSKGLLNDRLEWLSLPVSSSASILKKLDSTGMLQRPDHLSPGTLEKFLRWGLVSRVNDRSDRISLAFVRSLNLEITYDCPMTCRHCLQSGIRAVSRVLRWLLNLTGRRRAGEWLALA